MFFSKKRTFFILVTMIIAGCVGAAQDLETELDYKIPEQSDWIDFGTIIESGALGEWDHMHGGFTQTAVKRDGTYYLYYGGASGYRVEPDETVEWRSIGVATSQDGVNFTEYEKNPVITWFPSGYPDGNGEEGATSGGVTLDNNGDIVLYYGANTAVSSTSINADGRLAISNDGFNFKDVGAMLKHDDGSIWGSGDELFPIAAIQDAGQWIVYYLPNGRGIGRKLGVAWGDARDNLEHSSFVHSGFSTTSAWGTAGSAKVAPKVYAIFSNWAAERITEVRLMSLEAPYTLSDPVAVYRFDDVIQSTVILDAESRTWFMYYRHPEGHGIMAAPAGMPDTTPPIPPKLVSAQPLNDREVNLNWEPARDLETGIALYKVYRDGQEIDTVKGQQFKDSGLKEQTSYQYTVSAVNFHGTEGVPSKPTLVTTLPDTTGPAITSVNATGTLSQITVTFDEPVESISAETVCNYQIEDLSINQASLASDQRTVTLTTNIQQAGFVYKVTVRGVRDLAISPNPIDPGTTVAFTANPVAGLRGAWQFDEGEGEIVFDTANYGNNGDLLYTDKPGPSWTVGIMGHGLKFDGIDDQITISGSGTLQDLTDNGYAFAAWIRPDDVPSNRTVNDTFYTVLARKYNGIYYDHDGRIRGQIRLSDGTVVVVTSLSVDAGDWHHAAMVVDDVDKMLRLYVDGQEVPDSPVAFDGTLADYQKKPYYVGASKPLPERYEFRFKGVIDEVYVFDRALDLSDIELLANLNRPGFKTSDSVMVTFLPNIMSQGANAHPSECQGS